MSLLKDTKEFLLNKFDMKDLGSANYAIGIEIHHDRNLCMLGVSQSSYKSNVLRRFFCGKLLPRKTPEGRETK